MITFKTEQEIAIMHEGGKILGEMLRILKRKVYPGMTTLEIDKLARGLVFEYARKYPEAVISPAFLGYQGYPAAICTSVNDEIVHATPSSRILKEGDILSLDFGIVYYGWNLDSALTLPVSKKVAGFMITKINKEIKKLIRITEEALELGIKQVKIGNSTNDIGGAIENHARKNGFEVVRDLVGHGIGRKLHEAPYVPNYSDGRDNTLLKKGMVIAIEPMLVAGNPDTKETNYAFKTRDRSLSAHFEHTVAITEKGPFVLTR